MNNANDVRNELARVFADLKAGTISTKEASEFANIAGKMINSAKAQLEYAKVREETPTIDFLKSTDI